MALGQHGHQRMPRWFTAPTTYREETVSYCPRHKNKCTPSCPYCVKLRRRVPVPLSVSMFSNRDLPVVKRDAGAATGRMPTEFVQNYGLFGVESAEEGRDEEERDMALSGPHHHGGSRRSYYGYGFSPAPWWYSPLQYEYGTEEVWDGTQWVRRPKRSAVPITESRTSSLRDGSQESITSGSPEGEKYGVFGGSLSGIFARPRSRGMGDDGSYGVLSKKCRPYGSLSRRYRGNVGSLSGVDPTRIPRGRVMRSNGVGDDGSYGVLSKKCRPYGSLSRRYEGSAGSLSADPAPAPSPTVVAPMSMGMKLAIAAGVIGLGWWLFSEEKLERKTQKQTASVRRLADSFGEGVPRLPSTAIVPYEE